MSKSIDDFAAQLDATIEQVARYLGSSPMTVRRRISEGGYASFLDGKVRKVVVSTVLDDRQRLVEADARMTIAPGPGRPSGSKNKPRSKRAAE